MNTQHPHEHRADQTGRDAALRYSVVVPVHNEEGNITPLDREIKEVLGKLSGGYEIIYVNDASRDNSAEELAALTGVTIITLQRQYGQATALQAGFDHARGEIIISLDGDGQNDPADIPGLLQVMEEGKYDVVTGWRKVRQDKNGIRILTRLGRFMRRLMIRDVVHDTGCTLRVYTAHAAKTLDIGGEMHRYILALLRWNGFRVGEMVVNDRPRQHGVSKYGYSKAVRGFIDLIYIWFLYKYSQRPLHLFGYLGLGSFFLGGLAFLFTLYDRIFLRIHVNNDGWFFLSIFFMIGGIMLFSFGIIIDLLLRIYFNTSRAQKSFYVRDIMRG